MPTSDPLDSAPAKPRRTRVRRILLIIAANVVVLGGIGAYLAHHYFSKKAASFDLDELARMDSASTIFDRRNEVFGHIYLQNRDPIGMADISDVMVKTVIAAEDTRFYEHGGIDVTGIARAAVRNLGSGRVRQGASTITQQLARNTYSLFDRTLRRKVLECYLSWRIEKHFTKRQILEYYLNRIYFGSGFYGVEAAARGYFGKNTKQLSQSECATLAGLIRNPNNFSPWRNLTKATNARDYVLKRMLDTKTLTQPEYDAALADRLVVKPRTFASSDSYALETVRQQVIRRVGLTTATSEGLRVFTTLDGAVQRAAEKALRKRLDEIEAMTAFGTQRQTFAQYQAIYREGEKKMAAQAAADPKAPAVSVATLVPPPEYLQGSLVMVDNADGGLLAVVGGREFRHSEFNRAASSKRQLGTAFTPIVFAAAYERGFFPGSLVQDAVMDNRLMMVGGTAGLLGEWGVERADNRYEGLMPATFALMRGKNAAAARVGFEAGLENVLAFAKKAGIDSELRAYPASFLGQSEVTLRELALAYTMFPNQGWKPPGAYVVKRIEDRAGNVLFQAKARDRVKVTDENAAFQVHNALAENLKSGPARESAERAGFKRFPAGAKAGTSYNSTDLSLFGYTTGVTCAVWAGFDKSQTIFRGAFGGDLLMPVWAEVMNAAAQSVPPRDFVKPAGLRKVEICQVSGMLATEQCAEISPSSLGSPRRRTTYIEYATAAQAPKQTCTFHVGGVLPLATHLPKDMKEPKDGEPRRAERVVDLARFAPVLVTAPAVADVMDPYKALRPPLEATQVASAATPAASAGPAPEVRRAQPVRPLDVNPGAPAIEIEKPPAIEFN